jgi:hypothetical protein
MSVDYYVRLEQGRGPKPSRQILTALTRALMLTPDEREYLFRMAGENPPAVAGPSSELLPATRYLLDSLHETPAYVVNARYDVLAWNAMATHFIGDLSGYPTDDRNIIRWMFRRAAADQLWADDDSRRFHPGHDRRPAGRVRAVPGRPRHRVTGDRAAGRLADVRADVGDA